MSEPNTATRAHVGTDLVDLPGLHQMGIPFTRQRLLELEKAGRFPRRLKLAERRIAWLRSEIDAWLKRLAEARAGGGA